MRWGMSRRGLRRASRGQAEVIGGLVVLLLIFMFAVPILLNSYYSTQKTVESSKLEATRRAVAFNERLSIQAVDPNSEFAVRADLIPGVFINNTGTVDVTLDRLYLIDVVNNTIYAVFDLRYARPLLNPLIDKMLIDVDPTGAGTPPPPAGQPITLKPGQNLLIVFNDTILPVAPNLVVRVESATGVLHPLTSAGQGDVQLYPGRPGAVGLAGAGAWRGIFAPQSGFQLRGAQELLKVGEAFAWVPPLYVYADVDSDSRYEPDLLDYSFSFIYEDPDYPGLYFIRVGVDEWTFLFVIWALYGTVDGAWVVPGDTIELRGFVGTYEPGGGGTYFNGYAFAVRIYDSLGRLKFAWPERWGYASLDPVVLESGPSPLGQGSIAVTDFDGNGVEEVTVYSYLNGPNYDSTINVDADDDAYAVANDYLRDVLVWTYMVSRDISGVDFIRVTAKINYYWTTVFNPNTGCPDWDYRDLKIFAVVVFKYDPESGSWRVHQYQNFGYTSEKPVQFQPTVTFPVDRGGTYRVGVMFYDNYRDWDAYGLSCWTDFTMTLEHVIVEYGVVNPLFRESPPLYIVAIPDPTLIQGIGEYDYMLARNLSDLDTAKVEAQAELLKKIEEELNYAGVAGYTIIRDEETLYNLLFNANPPKYAIILWLQGEVPVSQVLSVYGVSESDVKSMMSNYNWVFVWVSGEPMGDGLLFTQIYFSGLVAMEDEGPFNLTITDTGVKARREFYAFYLYNEVLFNYTSYNMTNSCVVDESLFYWDPGSTPVYYGTVAYWVDCSPGAGAVLLNPVHIDWDVSGDGALPETVAQQVVYAALYTWETVRFG